MNKFETYIDKYTRIHDGVDPMTIGSNQVYSAGHRDLPGQQVYFSGGQFMKKFPKFIQKVIDRKERAITILDYGCGQAIHTFKGVREANKEVFHSYFKGMIQSYYCYDPAVRRYSDKPSPGSLFDIVVCADVMEHIPEEFVGDVLAELNNYTKEDGTLMFSISGVPAKKGFSDSENLHITIKTFEWWQEQFTKHINRSYVLYYKADEHAEVIDPDKYNKGLRLYTFNSDKFQVW